MSERFIDNRLLARATRFSHPQIRRWTVAFLPPDKAAGMQSGLKRLYSIDEAWGVYLGGTLVAVCGCGIAAARGILVEITRWMKAERLMPGDRFKRGGKFAGGVLVPRVPQIEEGEADDRDSTFDKLSAADVERTLSVQKMSNGKWAFEAREIVSDECIGQDDRRGERRRMEYVRRIFGVGAGAPAGAARELRISEMVESLMRGVNRHFG